MIRTSTRARVPVLALLTVLVSGCDGGPAGADEARRTQLLVSAASSLTDAFGDMERAFEEIHPDVEVDLNLAGSSTLREQIVQGAPADVFASADTATMADIVSAGLVAGAPKVFARNTLVIAVPSGNPAGITGLADLADPSRYVGLCAEAVPCGRLARQVLAAAGVTPAPDTLEPDVRALVTKIAAGELDAGMVYVTDVAAAGDEVDGVEFPTGTVVAADYPIAVLTGAADADGAHAFVDFVLSDEGRRILRTHGFALP